MYSRTQCSPKSFQLFFSLQKNNQPSLKKREDEFVLDCVNPQQSKLPQYHQDQDQYSQSYLTLLFSRLYSHKQNRSPRGTQLPRDNTKGVSHQQFREYLHNKLNIINQVKQSTEVLSYLSPQNKLQSSPKKALASKKSAFLDHKFRCFKRRKILGTSLQH